MWTVFLVFTVFHEGSISDSTGHAAFQYRGRFTPDRFSGAREGCGYSQFPAAGLPGLPVSGDIRPDGLTMNPRQTGDGR